MNQIRRFLVGGAVAGSLLTGGAIGATIAGPLAASAATTTNVATTAASPSAGSGTFVPNETAAHEAGRISEHRGPGIIPGPDFVWCHQIERIMLREWDRVKGR